jgi:hypothetical protein
MMGGAGGAAEFGVDVYGNMGQQQAAGPGGSIQMKGHAGGRRRKSAKSRKGKKMGGYGLTEVLVPATLFAANYAYGKNEILRVPKFARDLSRNRSSRRSRRGSRRFRR